MLCILSGCTVLTSAKHIAVPRLRNPVAFRPGAALSRPWTSRVSVSHPYTMFRPAQQYVYRRVPQMSRPAKSQPPHGRAGLVGYPGPWRTARPRPPPATSPYEFVRPASALAPAVVETGGKGAIHTIPAPNLSLSDKPIVVEDTSTYTGLATTQTKPNYEVTEKIEMDFTTVRPVVSMVEVPQTGFSRGGSLIPPELTAFVHGGTLQLVDYVPPAIAIPHNHYAPQYSAQAFDTVIAAPVPITNNGFMPQSGLFKPDHSFLQNANNQLYQNYPIEFVPYQPEKQPEPHVQPQVHLIDNEVTKNKEVSQVSHKNVIRDTQENLIVTLAPQVMEVMNVTEQSTKGQTEAVTTDIVTSEPPLPTTVKQIVESTTQKDKTTPTNRGQIGRSVGNIMAKGFYSAINEVRAAAALAQVENVKTKSEASKATTKSPGLERNESAATKERNVTANQKTFIRGVPFSKPEKTDVAYTILRAEDRDKVTKDGAVYAGQIVEAAVMEGGNGAGKGGNLSAKPPIRLMMRDDREVTTEKLKSPTGKTKMSPESKIVSNDKTGETVLRIFPSYVENPSAEEILIPKTNIKQIDTTEKHQILDGGKEGNLKNSVKIHGGSDMNQVMKFGVQLRPKLDDYTSIFDEGEKK